MPRLNNCLACGHSEEPVKVRLEPVVIDDPRQLRLLEAK